MIWFESLPKKQYDIIYADPPWNYGKPQHGGVGVANTGGAETHYGVMKTKDIAMLDVISIAKEDCLLFMWTSNPFLQQAIDLGIQWHFKYATVAFVWDKVRVNPGSYTMSQCELCLVFKRGKIPLPRGARNVRQFLSEKRGAHSEKPTEVRDRIVQMFPEQSKIELFAREKVEGWDSWGNEI